MSSRFGERLRTLRKERGVSISCLAKGTGLSRKSIYRWEHGANTPRSLETITLLADFFRIPPYYFFENDANLHDEVRQLREEVSDLRRHINGDAS